MMPDTILVVDDDELMRNTIAGILRTREYDVVIANDGREAFGLIKERAGKFAAVVTDMMMPDMNGRALYEVISHCFPDIPFLFMSGYPDACDWLLEDDAAILLMKPIKSKDLLEAVGKLLSRN